MVHLTEEQLQTYSRDWRQCFTDIAQRGYEIMRKDGRLVIRNKKKKIELHVQLDRSCWRIITLKPNVPMRHVRRDDDQDAIARLQACIVAAERALSVLPMNELIPMTTPDMDLQSIKNRFLPRRG